MPAAGLGATELILHCETSSPGFVAHRATCDKLVKRDGRHLSPDAAGRPEIWNTTFGRDAGTREGLDNLRGGDHLAEFVDSLLKTFGNHARRLSEDRSQSPSTIRM